MKIYATITTDRATKGQGGNQYLDVVITGEGVYTDELLRMRLLPDGYGHARVESVSGSHSLMRGLMSMMTERIEDDIQKMRKGKK